jgi:phytoene synthase
MTDLDAPLDRQVRAADPDRWLSSRFAADEAARADLIALYALEAELDAIPRRVSQPLLAEMRFAWWAEHLEQVIAGAPRKGHPVLEALGRAHARRPLDGHWLGMLVDSRVGDLNGEWDEEERETVRPFQRYGAAMLLAANMLGAETGYETVESVARLWGEAVEGRPDAARALRADANRALARLPAAAFPAVAHAALIRRDQPEALKRLRLVWAVARGRI